MTEQCVTTYCNDANVDAIPKFSFFTTIHKAIRKEMFEVCFLAGTTRFYDAKETAPFVEKMSTLFNILRAHAEHEDLTVNPLLIKKNLLEHSILFKEHQEFEKELISLENQLAELLALKNKTLSLEEGNHFYLALCRFAGQYLEHLFFEETHIMPLLCTHYDLSELMVVLDEFIKAQSFEDTLASAPFLLRTLNSDEALFFLIQQREALTQKQFQELWQLAKQSIPEHYWHKITALL